MLARAGKVPQKRHAGRGGVSEMDDYATLVDWILEGSDQAQYADRDLMAHWLRPNFQNYTDTETFHVNPNGRALRDLAAMLRERHQAARQARPPRGATKSILLVSRYAPSTSHAGGLRIFDLYAELRRLNPSLRLELYSPSEPAIDGNTDMLTSIFDRVHWTKPDRFSYGDCLLRVGAGARFDLLDAQFHDAGRFIGRFRPIAKRLLFTPMECMARTTYEKMQMHLSQNGALKLSDMFHTLHATLDELRIVAAADETICVSDADANFLRRIAGRNPVDFIPTGLSEVEFGDQLRPEYTPQPPSQRRKLLVFAAYYGSDTNVVGLRWYLDEVHPKVLAAVPEYKVMVVGRGDLNWLRGEDRPNVTIVGEVPVLSPVLDQARAGLVLALHGSGFRGKINQYAVCGLPSISTPLGLTGLVYTPGEDIIQAEAAGEFAVECIRVLTDGGYVDRVAARARETALKHYVWSTFMDRIRDIYGV
jgi:glycosyltransferase involved in cell wall biosynthesis